MALHVDETLALGNGCFEELTYKSFKTFELKRIVRNICACRYQHKKATGGYFFQQENFPKRIQPLQTPAIFCYFCATRQKLACLVNTRP